MIEDTEERAVRYVQERDEDGHALPMVFRAQVDPVGLDRVLARMHERLDALEREVRGRGVDAATWLQQREAGMALWAARQLDHEPEALVRACVRGDWLIELAELVGVPAPDRVAAVMPAVLRLIHGPVFASLRVDKWDSWENGIRKALEARWWEHDTILGPIRREFEDLGYYSKDHKDRRLPIVLYSAFRAIESAEKGDASGVVQALARGMGEEWASLTDTHHARAEMLRSEAQAYMAQDIRTAIPDLAQRWERSLGGER